MTQKLHGAVIEPPQTSLAERVASTSYVANLPDSEKTALRQKTDSILREAGLGDADEVVFPYVTQLFLLKRV